MDIQVYNHVSSTRNPLTWREFSEWNDRYGRRWPTIRSIWYPSLYQVRNGILFNLLSFLLHTVPAYLADAFLYLTGQQTMLVKGYKKINKFLDVIGYFSINLWKFSDNNLLSMWTSLSAADQEIFPFDPVDINWDYYAQGHLLGLRHHLTKESIDTLPAAKTKFRRLFIIHAIFCGVLLIFCLWVFSKILGWSFL